MSIVNTANSLSQIPSAGPLGKLTEQVHQMIYDQPALTTITTIACMILGVGIAFSGTFLTGMNFYVFLSFGSLLFISSALVGREIAIINKDFIYHAYQGLNKYYKTHEIDPSKTITIDENYEKNLAKADPNKALYSCSYQVGEHHITNGAIFFINGMDNSYSYAKSSARYLSRLGHGVKISGVHNATHGKRDDIIECQKNLWERVATPPVLILKKNLEQSLGQNPAKKVLLIAHSQGAIQTGLAIELLAENHPEYLPNIHLVSIAPGAYLPKWISNHIGSYRAYLSPKDPIPMIHNTGRIDQRKALRILDRHPSISTIDPDHEFSSDTYTMVLASKIEQFVSRQGGLIDR